MTQASKKKSSDRNERLKQALRANLKRRKTQAKAKQTSERTGKEPERERS